MTMRFLACSSILVTSGVVLSGVRGDCTAEITAFQNCFTTNPTACQGCGTVPNLDDSSITCTDATASFCNWLNCCNGCKSEIVNHFSCIGNLYGTGGVCGDSGGSLGDVCGGGGNNGGTATVDCATDLAELNSNSQVSSAAFGMRFSDGSIDLDFCRTNTATLTIECIYNLDILDKRTAKEAADQACTAAGGVPAEQEFITTCDSPEVEQLDVLAKFVYMPVCTKRGCVGATNLAPYHSSFEDAFLAFMTSGTECDTVLSRTYIPGED